MKIRILSKTIKNHNQNIDHLTDKENTQIMSINLYFILSLFIFQS